MSNEALTAVWNHSRATNGQRLVLLALADRANDDNLAWPSITELQRMTRLARATVCQALTDLQNLGELTIEPHRRGPRGQNLYRLNPNPPETESNRTSPQDGTDSGLVQSPDQSGIRTGSSTESGLAVVQIPDLAGSNPGPHNPQEPSSNPTAAAGGLAAPAGADIVPTQAAPLVKALTEAGLVVGWRLTAAQWATVCSAIERCGIAPMVAYARRRHLSAHTPAWSAAAWVSGWSSLPPVPAADGTGTRRATVTLLRPHADGGMPPSRNAAILHAARTRARATRPTTQGDESA